MTTTSNLDQLSTIEESTILELLKSRFEQDEICTFAGPALVVVNPYNGSSTCPGAVSQLANGVLSKLQSEKKNQTVLLKGISGSGKTSQAKNVINAITEQLGAEASSLNTSFEATNVILNAFAAARTIRASSSNRALNITQLQFDEAGALVGSKLISTLFDTSRVSTVDYSERNFHILYQLVSNPESQKKYDLENAGKYHFLNQNETTISGVDDSHEFDKTSRALDTLGISAADKDNLFSALAGILHLGNVTFAQTGDAAHVVDKAVVARAAKYLGVSDQALEQVLVSVTYKVVGEVVKGTVDAEKAASLRNGLAQAIYKKTYESLIERINAHLKLKEAAAVKTTLSIVELNGFEVNQSNGKEQLYINYVNEIAQDVVHKNPAAADSVKAVTGVITSLAEQALMPKAGDAEKVTEVLANYLKTNKAFSTNRFDRKVFTLKHHPGQVAYDTSLLIGYTVANEKQKEVLLSSSNPLLHGTYVLEFPIITVKKSAASLAALLKDSQVTEVIAIRPNYSKKPKTFDDPTVQDQIITSFLVDLAKQSKK